MTRKRLEKQLETLFSDSDAVIRGAEPAPKEASQPRSPAEWPKARPPVEESSEKLTQPNPGSPGDQRDLVTFRLAQQTYALPIEPIVQIIEMVTITSIPQIDGSVEGVINVRGVVVPVVNLRRHFGLPEAPFQLHTPIVLLQVDAWTVGLIVDEVIDVLRLAGEQVVRTAQVLPQGLGQVPMLQGLTHTSEGVVLLLDVEHLLLPVRSKVLAEAVATLPGGVVEEDLTERGNGA